MTNAEKAAETRRAHKAAQQQKERHHRDTINTLENILMCEDFSVQAREIALQLLAEYKHTF